jgi:hypothetical protein
VSPGLTPTITWSPACGIGSISIVRQWYDSASGIGMSEAVWAIETSNEGDPLVPPVAYGVVPTGFHVVWSPKPLVAGQSYNLTLEVHSREPVGPVLFVGFDPVTRLDFSP